MSESYIEKLIPFICNMRVGQDGEQPIPPTPASLIPFSVGQIIKGFDFGNVNNGDTNSELDAFLLALEPSMEPSPLVAGSSDVVLMAMHIQVEGIDASVLLSSTFENEMQGEMAPLYSTSAFELEGISFIRGYQNLTNGKIQYPYDDYYSEIVTIRDDASLWNGIFVGAVEKEPGPTPPVPPTPTTEPFEVNQVLLKGDKIHIDTTKGEDAYNLLSNYDYTEAGTPQVMLLGTDRMNFVVIMMDMTQMGSTGYVLTVGSPSDLKVVYATESGEVNGMSWVAGFQNLDEEGNVEITYGESHTVTSIIDTNPQWNGNIISKVISE